MTNTRLRRSREERRAIVEVVDLRIQSGGMTHREATRLEGISDALVHSWRRTLQQPDEEEASLGTSPTPRTRSPRRINVARKQPNPSFEFLIDFMKSHPEAVYADAAAAASDAGHKIHPIVWGRAQLLLGRVKAGEGKQAARQKAAADVTTEPDDRLPERAPAPAREGIAIPGASVEELQDLVDALNEGGRAILRYDDKRWTLIVE